jgi:hypothetical protein
VSREPERRVPSEAERRLRRILETRCVRLKTKRSYLGPPSSADEETWDTAVWWCEATLKALGPDGSAAHPSACDAAGRPCYEAPRRP